MRKETKNLIKSGFLPFIIITLVFLSNCSTTPLIGRKQMLLIPESQLVSMGATNYKGLLDTMPLALNTSDTKKT